jgi:hypothetical protein
VLDIPVTKTCSRCKKTDFGALFPSLKGKECHECMSARNKKYNKLLGRDPKRRWRNNTLFGKKNDMFEWERHLDLQENF